MTARQASNRLSVNESIAFIKDIMENSQDPFLVVYPSGQMAYCNTAFCNLSGYNREELAQKSWMDLICPLKTDQKDLLLFQEKQGNHWPAYLITRSGNLLEVEAKITDSSLGYEDHRLFYILLRQINPDIWNIETIPSLAIFKENSRDIIYRVRLLPYVAFEYVSPAVTSITGYTPEQLYSEPDMVMDMIYPEDRPIFTSMIKGDHNHYEVAVLRLMGRYGKIIWTEHNYILLRNSHGTPCVLEGIARDITHRKHIEEELRFLSLHDPLTGLHNRAYFDEEMRRLETGRYDPVGILLCDVDGLKIINDTMGHQKGDELLITAAEVIKKCFRNSDVVARIGGDEFAVLLSRAPNSIVRDAYRRIKENVTRYNEEHGDLPLSLSIGFSVRENREITMDELFRTADSVMYQEKLRNKRQFIRSVASSIVEKAGDNITCLHN